MEPINKPDKNDDERAFALACAGKRGQYIANSDLEWLKNLYDKYPEWGINLGKRAFESTKPYGAL